MMSDLMNSSLGGLLIQNRTSRSFAHSRLRKINLISLFRFLLTMTAWLFFRMFSILLKNGSVERFVVRDRKAWASEIEKAVEELCKKNGIYRDIHKKVGYKVPPISHRSIIKTAIQATIVAICIAVLIYVLL